MTKTSLSQISVDALLRDLAVPKEAPGAIAATAIATAIASAIGASATQDDRQASRLMEIAARSLALGDLDTVAYSRWRTASAPLSSIQEGPRAVAEIASALDSLLLELRSTTGVNAIDVAVARCLARASATASTLVREGNSSSDAVRDSLPLKAAAATPMPSLGRPRLQDLERPQADGVARARLWLPGSMPGGEPLLQARRAWRCWVEDSEGRVWFDATSGMWNTPLGHGRPEIIEAFASRALSLHSIDPFQVTTEDALVAAEALSGYIAFPGYILFSSSGSEAVETALRIALMRLPGAPVYALPGAFHGSTMGAAQLAGFQTVWAPYPAKSRFIQTRSPAEWSAPGIGFVEPMQGANVGTCLSAIDASRIHDFQKAGGLVVADEVACGLGRIGSKMASRQLDLSPDIVILGKGLANGVAPISATLVGAHVGEALRDSDLEDGHTHSNHPPSLAAAVATLKVLAEEDVHVAAMHTGRCLATALSGEGVAVSGKGAFLTVSLRQPLERKALLNGLRDTGLLLHVPTSSATVEKLILAPPLDLSADEAQDLTNRTVSLLRSIGSL